MQALVVFISAIVVCYGATTHRPHSTHAHTGHHTTQPHEPGEFETISFQFSFQTGHLLVKVHPDKNTLNCYIATLSDAEHAQIHTDAGMRAVELRLLAALSTATMVTDKTTLDQHDVQACGAHTTKTPSFYTIMA
ncbi:uncharacterized protein LOC127858303 [Dreissena polymorpha]|uniref:Uncharacterized protein n=1 Tax=Dreissena polymorpha TaxID=45954 RepID=A0A9D3Z060_DREPO|nr:uncharacterized protein LOC127858303 [Dreissena polymorpha]KAH3710603.1 hypothetical protein DPMN_070091 [Dreissena polymorpha]